MGSRDPVVRRRDRALFNALWFAEHCFGNAHTQRWLDAGRSRVDQRIRSRLLRRPVSPPREVARFRDLAPDEFRSRTLARPAPIVLEGLAAEWPCVRRWTPRWLAEHYADAPLHVTEDPAEPGGDYRYEEIPVRDAVRQIREGSRRYARFSPLLKAHPELLYDFDCRLLDRYAGARGNIASQQFFMGGKGTATYLHNAPSDNFFVQVSGRKRWIVLAPEHSPVIRPRVDRTPYFRGGADFDADGFEQLPLIRRIETFSVELGPGDVLFNPAFFWHHVVNLTDSIGISFRSRSPASAVKASLPLTLLTALATRPNALSRLRDVDEGHFLPRWYG